MTTENTKKVGRPEKYDDTFYNMVLDNHVNKKISLTKLAKYHGVSVSTITRWLKKGREMNEQTKS